MERSAGLKVVILMAVLDFDEYYEGLGVDRERYLTSFMGDWSLQYARALGDRGIDVALYHFSSRVRAIERLHHEVADCEVVLLPLSAATRLVKHLPRHHVVASHISALSRPLFATLRADRPDVCYVHEYGLGRFDVVTPIAHRLGIPVVGAFHGGVERPYHRLLKRWSLPLADAITCTNAIEAGRLVQTFPGVRPLVVPNFYDDARFVPMPRVEACDRLGLRSDRPRVCFVGRLQRTRGEYQKGLEQLLCAVGALRRQGHDLELVVIGSGPHASEAVAVAAAAGVEDVRWVPWVDDADTLRSWYCASDVLVQPSLREAFGIVAVEAMGCARPVIGTEGTGLADVVVDGETGFLVPVRDSAVLATRLRILLVDGRLRAAMGEAARRRALGHYTRDRVVDRLVCVLEGVAGR